MFNTVQRIVSGLATGMTKPQPPRTDPLVEGMSHTIQEHESAASRLRHVLCKALDGPQCPCLKITAKQ